MSELNALGFTGTLDDLASSLEKAQSITDFEMVYAYFDQLKSDKEINQENLGLVRSLVDKLAAKYPSHVNKNGYRPKHIYFYGSKHPTLGRKFVICLEFSDSTSRGRDGFWGDFHVRIIYGFDGYRRDKYITLIERKAY